jgi:hypothetical protein
MVANTINIKDELIVGKLVACPEECKSLVNGTYHVSIKDGHLAIHLGLCSFKMKPKVISKICEKQTVTYILEDNRNLTLRI